MYLLFDIGGTKMRLALSGNRKSFGKVKIVPTPKRFSEAMGLFGKTARELANGKKFSLAIGGTPGPFNKARTKIFPQNLPQWKNKDLKKALEKTLRAKVYLENDSALVGMGEVIYGAGKGRKIVAYLTISTGVGGARIVEGKIDRNSFGFEPGGQIIDKGLSKTLEDMISGKALEHRYHKKPHEILDPKIWNQTARLLAVGLNNTIVHWSPDVIVLGGSMMKKIGIPIPRVREHLKKILRFPAMPAIRKASLGDLGGLYGALAFLKDLK